MEDNDDSTSAKELAEKGYILPEYHFVAEYDGVESEGSKVLEVKGWVCFSINPKQNDVIASYKFNIYLKNFKRDFSVNFEQPQVNILDLPPKNEWKIGVRENG